VTELAARAVAQPPDEDHFEKLVQRADDLVIFLGAGANTDGATRAWEPGCGYLPDDADLARHIATRAQLKDAPPELSQVAQRVRATQGEGRLFDWLLEGLTLGDDTAPSAVDKLLAGLPNHFRDQGLPPRYQMIVTTKYDGALEKAFRDAKEEFDVATYMAPRPAQAGRPARAGGFVHVAWDGDPVPRQIERPNSELVFPFDAVTRQLSRTVIVRLSCTVDEALGLERADNYVVTEDDFIDFLSGRPVGEVVPTQILAKLRKANYLFLGFTIVPWRLRVFLHRVWGGQKLGEENYWAVERLPEQLDKDLWNKAGVTLYQQSLTDYLNGLYSYIKSLREPQP
jgi:hypothetical protein